jgi:asparagine synthase (glutamine-hydrolysing)
MSAILIVRDPDPVATRIRPMSAEASMRLFGLIGTSVRLGPIWVMWGGFVGAPFSQAPGTLVLGDAIPGPGPERLTAEQYAGLALRASVPPPLDGFHVAATFDPQGAITVATDILGAYPIYYANVGEKLLIASSPALIRAHLSSGLAVDPLGLIGLLLTNGSLRGRTPYREIRRLAAGHVLVAPPNGPPREVRHYSIATSRASHDVPVEECAARLHGALVDAARRHVPDGEPHTLLLSGGIDSRLIGGVLARQGARLNAITRGVSTDLEYRCARAVARRLGLSHALVPHLHATFEEFERMIEWEGMASGPDTAMVELNEPLPGLEKQLVSGYMADPILGGVTVSKAFDAVTRTNRFETFLARTNAWGVPLEALPRLLRPDVFGDGLEQVVSEFCEDFTNAGETDLERSWLHTMQLKERFQIGGTLARLATRSWPRSPHVDRTLLDVVAGIPLPMLDGRRLQREVLTRFHPELARLPLDHNDPDVTPLLPGAGDLLRAGLARRVRRARRALGMPEPERRYYHLLFDFNGRAWRAIRREAEAHRERAYALFDREAFDRLLPRPDVDFPPTQRVEEAAAAKLLLGVCVWLGQRDG